MVKENITTVSLWNRLQETTKVGIDTFCFKDYKHFKPQFGTSNPSIVRNHFVNEEATAISNADFSSITLETAMVQEALPIIEELSCPIALQVNPFFANHYKQTLENAKLFCHLFNKAGVDKDAYYIKIPATWEGIQAASELEKKGVQCIATAVFSLVQANTCAEFGISYIAPYVSKLQEAAQVKKSRITGKSHYGVELVQNMYTQTRKISKKTKVLAASFNTLSEIFSISNMDAITVKPKLAFELQNETEVPSLHTWKELPKVTPAKDKHAFDEKLLQDPIAADLLAKTLSKFNFSWLNLRQLIVEKKEVLAAS